MNDARFKWRVGCAGCLAFLLCSVLPAHADIRDYLGRTIIDVRVELGNTPLVEASILQLVQTRVGQPLSMERVRETIDHLVGLGRFEDVRVFAEASRTNDKGVSLRWALVPVQRVVEIDITGNPDFDKDTLSDLITERFGLSPGVSRSDEIVQVLSDYYRDRGYRAPRIQPAFVQRAAPELVTLSLAIVPGPRTLIGDVSVTGDAGRPVPSLVAELQIERGRPFDRPAIETRVSAFEDELRELGYYEANVELTSTFSEDGATAALVMEVERGPRVRVVFAGDPLPENRRETLVPIRQERSVDLDLLEDASRNIEAFLRQQGYRAAEAPYIREERAGEMVLTFTVARGPLHRLSSIEVSGNSAIALADITPLLPLKPGEPFDDGRIGTVTAAVTELYRVRGFGRVSVKPELSVLPPQSANGDTYRPVVVRLVVTEGPQTTIGEVTIQGSSEIGDARVRPLLALTSGRPFYRPQLDADRDTVERFYRNQGYRDARVSAETVLHDDGTAVDVQWTVREGPRTLVDHVLVTGNVRTSVELIQRELALQPGTPLGEEALLESQRRLAALGLFRRVRIVELPHGQASRRDILVEVEEAPSTTISYGGGLEAGRRLRPEDVGGDAEERIEVAPRGFFEVTRRNLFGRNRSASLFTRVSLRSRDPAADSTDPTDVGGYGFNEYRVVATFREPRALNSPGDVQLTAFIEQAGRPSFNFSRRGVRTEYGRRIGSATTVSGRYAIDRTRLFDEQTLPEDQLLIDRLFPQVRLSTFTGSVLRDSRDDVLDPERGTVIGVDGTVGARALGSEVGFIKSFAQAFVYRRLSDATRLTLVAGIRLGFATGFERLVERVDADGRPVLNPDGSPVVDRLTDVPASERFFAGGDTTVRGFVLDRLGTEETLNDQGFPTGGNGLAVVNLELRTPYWKGLGGVGFFDAGNVFERANDVAIGDLRPAAGFGVRYRSPVGPLRVDLGFNLDRQLLPSGMRERRTVFHISLGQAF